MHYAPDHPSLHDHLKPCSFAQVFRKEGRFSVERYFLLQLHLGVPGLRSFDGIAGENAELK